MQATFITMERILIWPLMACVLVIAGYQAGVFGARLVYPDVPGDAVGQTSQQDFASVSTVTSAQSDATVVPLFGVAPEQVSAPAPQVAEIAPNTTYQLQGITVTGPQRWAMLTSGGSSLLVRPGDTLKSGETVNEITTESVLLDAGGTLTILRFTRASEAAQSAAASLDAAVMADFNPEPAVPDTPRVTRVAPKPVQIRTKG